MKIIEEILHYLAFINTFLLLILVINSNYSTTVLRLKEHNKTKDIL